MEKFKISLKMLILALGFSAVAPSCTDLDEELFSQVSADNFFQTEEELVSALGAAYTSLYGFAGNGTVWGIQEVSSDEVVVPTRGPDWGDGGHWVRLHQQNWTAEDPLVNGGWSFLFGGVSATNRLIYQFELLNNPLTEPFIGELKALRAIYYLWLLDLYGNVPIVTSFADADPNPATNSRVEVYNFVESELTSALNSVTDAVDGSTYGRVNKNVVNTALARLYLNAEVYTGSAQWSKAAAAADAVINSGNYALESDYFANFNVDNSGSGENIWVIPYDEVFAGGFNLVMMTLSYLNQQSYNLAAQPWNGFCTVEEFYNSYEDTDLRKGQPNTEDGPSAVRGNFLVGPQWDVTGRVRLVDDGTTASGIDPDGPPFTLRAFINELFPTAWREAGARIAKYEFQIGGRQNMNNDYPLFRYADVLLMKAEALWRQNPGSAEALALVNQIRSRAGVDSFSELTADNLLAERGREMFAEAIRRTDLIRFGVFTDAWWAKDVQPECKELMPIPKNQTDSNPNLVQNECY